MSSRVLAIGLAIVSLLCAPVSAQQRAGADRGDWSNLRKLKPEARVFVATKSGAEYEGEFRGATDDGMRLTNVRYAPGGTVEVKRGDVHEVRKVRSRFVRNLVGGAIAAGVFFGTLTASVAAARASDSEGAIIVPALAIPAGGIAAGFIGDRVADKLRKGERIYVAP